MTKIPTNLTLGWSFAYHKHARQRRLHSQYRSALIRSPVKEYNFLWLNVKPNCHISLLFISWDISTIYYAPQIRIIRIY